MGQRFVAGGFGQRPDKPHPERRGKVTEALVTALERLLDESNRTWTTPQLAQWLAEHLQVDVHPDHLARLLHRRGFRGKRTKRSVAHQRKDPDFQAAKVAERAVLKKSGPKRCDRPGFPGSKRLLAHHADRRHLGVDRGAKDRPPEAPEGWRVNVVGARFPVAPAGSRLIFESRCKGDGRNDANAHRRFVEKLAGLPPVLPDGYRRERPLDIALDNSSVHDRQLVKEIMPVLDAAGVRFFLPPDSPEMNAIEPHWRQIPYQDLPERSDTTVQALKAAVDEALTNRAEQPKGTARSHPETHAFLCRSA